MVTLRAKRLSSGKYHLFIDIYIEGKRLKEYLKIYVNEDYTAPLKDKDGKIILDKRGNAKFKKVRDEDSQNWQTACDRKKKVDSDLTQSIYSLDHQSKKNRDFLSYFSKYVNNYRNKNKRAAQAALAKYELFSSTYEIDTNEPFLNGRQPERMTKFKHISVKYVEDYKHFLKSALNGETPADYFKFFKAAIKLASQEGFLQRNYAEDITISRSNEIVKDILYIDELRKLYNTPCGNDQVKRAFLFSCYTGLDFNDIKNHFRWGNVKESNGTFGIAGRRGKTGKKYDMEIDAEIFELLGTRGDFKELVFKLPSHNGTLGNLDTWVKKAGIQKHITYHCARHTFGSGLIEANVDFKTASRLMTHSSLNQVLFTISTKEITAQTLITSVSISGIFLRELFLMMTIR